jgi:hypothetical protein
MTDAPKRIWINIDAPWDGLINPVHGTGGLPGYILDTPAALSKAPEVKALIAEAVERAVELIDLAVELAQWDLNPKLRDDMIDFTTEIKGDSHD